MSILRSKWFKILWDWKIGVFLTVALIALVVASFLGYHLPKMIADLFESYDRDRTFFIQNATCLLFIYLGEYFNRVLYSLTLNRFIQHILIKIRLYCYSEWLLSYEVHQSNEKKKEYPLGEVLARLINDTESIRELVSAGVFGVFIDIIFIGSCLYGFIELNLASGVLIAFIEVVTVVLLIIFSRSMVNTFFRARRELGILSRTVADVCQGMGENYYNNHGNFAQTRVKKQFQRFLREQLRANFFEASYSSLAESLFPLFLACIGVVFSYSPLVTGGVVAAMVDLVQRSIDPIKDITGKIGEVRRASAGLTRIREFVQYFQQGLKTRLRHSFKDIHFESLEIKVDKFSYKSTEEKGREFSLSNIHLKGKCGELVGIVGSSGSGKSTLLKILSCELLPERGGGRIKTADGAIDFEFNNIEKLQSYREQVSLVSQDSHVFTASLAFNISLDLEDGQHDKIENFWNDTKVKIPYIESWGITLTDTIDSRKLSMGQKQLLCALRACYLKRPVVLFDEISSGLDSDLELALRQLVLLVQQHALTIIVAHRLETLIHAQKIMVMDKGECHAWGTHLELLGSSSLYRNFVNCMTRFPVDGGIV